MEGWSPDSRNRKIPYVPGATYLSVLLANRKLEESYRRLQVVVKAGIRSEEDRIKHKPKLGYGSRFNSARQRRSQSLPSVGTRPHSVAKHEHRRPASTKYSYKSKSPRRTPLSLIDIDRFEPTPRPASADQEVIDRLVIDGTLDEIYSQRKQLLTRCEPLWFPRSDTHSIEEMLSPPELPGGGLRRETTSFGVYSNLAAHSHREPTKSAEPRRVEPLVVVTTGLQLKLVQAIKRSDTDQVLQIFREYPDLKLQFVDENDKTVLHHCIDVQKRKVNSEILKFLLEKKPLVIDYCRNEAPVLHNAARLGHVLSVYFLLKHGANINVQYKRTFRTALHEAVIHGHKTVVEILLYNGANTTVREKDGRFACDLCKDTVFPREAYDAIEDGVAHKRIEIKELSAGLSSVSFNNIGVTVQFSSEVRNAFPILIKRQIIETSDTRFLLPEEEDLASDVFSYRMLEKSGGTSAKLSLPLFDKSFSSREEIVVKAVSGEVIVPEDMHSGKDGLVVVFEVDIKETESFVCVCRPKVERWLVGKGQTILGSVIDEQVRIHIDKNSFSSKGSLRLQVIELPENVDIKEGTILASTPFYKIDVDGQARHITLELPKPGSFDGECVVLAQSGQTWRVVEVHDDYKYNTVSFTENYFPLIATVAVTKPNSPADLTIQEMQETLKLVSNIQFRVIFLFYAKRIANTRKFTVLVECCEVKVMEARRRFWKGQGYKEQPQKDVPAQIGIQSKQAFKVVFYESAILRKDPKLVDLEFHRKRDNVIKFNIELKGKSIQFINGRLYVYAAQHADGNKDEVIGKEHLSSVDINLVLNQMEIGQSSSDGSSNDRNNTTLSVKSHNTSSHSGERPSSRTEKRPGQGSRNGKDVQVKRQDTEPQTDALKKVQASLARAMRNIDPVLEEEESDEVETADTEEESCLPDYTDTVFLDDALLDLVIDELGDDWYKIFVLAGLPFVEIDEMLLQSKNMIAVKRQLFRKWRDLYLDRDDLGLPFLLGALFKGGCRNVATIVQIKLRNWHEKWKSRDNEFTKWVSKAYHDSDLFVPSDYPKPMSDQYLVLMSDELPPSRNLARAMLIADTASSDILDNPNYILDGVKVMKILTSFRDRTDRGVDALEKLIAVLGDLGFDKLRKYALMCANAWLKRTATRKDDPFRYQVDALMNKLQ